MDLKLFSRIVAGCWLHLIPILCSIIYALVPTKKMIRIHDKTLFPSRFRCRKTIMHAQIHKILGFIDTLL